ASSARSAGSARFPCTTLFRSGLALMQGEGDEDVAAVGRNGDLRRVGGVLEVAAVEIEGPQSLHVALELLARVFVCTCIPGHQPRSEEHRYGVQSRVYVVCRGL